MIEISAESMALVVDGEIVASARFSQHAAADGNGAWIVSTHPARLFTRNGAITALTLAERLAAGCGRGGFAGSPGSSQPKYIEGLSGVSPAFHGEIVRVANKVANSHLQIPQLLTGFKLANLIS